MAECVDKNMIDKDEYPQTAELERRCVRMLADLWHAPTRAGCHRLLDHRVQRGLHAGRAGAQAPLAARPPGGRQTGRPTQPGHGRQRPGVLGEVRQLLGGRAAPGADGGRPVPPRPPREAVAHCDENTIGVVAILGSTFDGSYEPVAEICAALDELQASTGLRHPGARRRRVRRDDRPVLSTPTWCGTSGCPGSPRSTPPATSTAWSTPASAGSLWRDAAALPEDLVFQVNYLGGDMPTFALNFSRPGAQVVAQYYNFLRLGREGYRRVQQTCRDVATALADRIGELRTVPAAHPRRRAAGLRLHPPRARHRLFRLRRLRRAARARLAGARLHLPRPTAPTWRCCASWCRNGFTHDLADLLLADLRTELPRLGRQSSPQRGTESSSFSHGASPPTQHRFSLRRNRL